MPEGNSPENKISAALEAARAKVEAKKAAEAETAAKEAAAKREAEAKEGQRGDLTAERQHLTETKQATETVALAAREKVQDAFKQKAEMDALMAELGEQMDPEVAATFDAVFKDAQNVDEDLVDLDQGLSSVDEDLKALESGASEAQIEASAEPIAVEKPAEVVENKTAEDIYKEKISEINDMAQREISTAVDIPDAMKSKILENLEQAINFRGDTVDSILIPGMADLVKTKDKLFDANRQMENVIDDDGAVKVNKLPEDLAAALKAEVAAGKNSEEDILQLRKGKYHQLFQRRHDEKIAELRQASKKIQEVRDKYWKDPANDKGGDKLYSILRKAQHEKSVALRQLKEKQAQGDRVQ